MIEEFAIEELDEPKDEIRNTARSNIAKIWAEIGKRPIGREFRHHCMRKMN